MSEDLSHLIEIGDPEDDPVVPAPASDPQVVIEYRDRGLPWMLVLPLLVTAAAAAIIGFKAFDDRVGPSPPIALAPDPAPVAEATPLPSPDVPGGMARDLGGPPEPAPSPLALPLASLPPEAEIPPDPPALAASAVVDATPPVEPPAPPAEEPRPFPQVAGLGFDPDALTRPDAPDDVRAAGHPVELPGPAQPAVAAVEPEQPRTVDPKDLPPDPRLAERERFQRWVEARKRLDEDRARFHADLRAICKRFGADAAPQITDMCRRYGTEPDPIAKAQAARMLTVSAAGVDPKVRVNLLRSLGFPEASILLDIAETRGRWEDGKSRNGPRTRDDVLRTAALILLRYPPGKASASARPTSATPSARPAGSFR